MVPMVEDKSVVHGAAESEDEVTPKRTDSFAKDKVGTGGGMRANMDCWPTRPMRGHRL